MTLVMEGVTKRLGDQIVLHGLSLRVDSGIVGLLGPNGAGKTTLLRILATLLTADRGQIFLDGLSYRQDASLLHGQIGYLPQDLDLPMHLTTLDLLRYLALIRELPARVVDLQLDQLDLRRIARQRLTTLSGGELRRVGIAQALLGSPRLIVLDEPTKGLDLHERQRLFRVLRSQPRRSVIMLSSHIADDIALIADQLVLLREGRLRYGGTLEGLYRTVRAPVVEVCVPAEAVDSLLDTCCVSAVTHTGDGALLRVVGPHPAHYPARSVEATLADLYLLLQQQAPPSNDQSY